METDSKYRGKTFFKTIRTIILGTIIVLLAVIIIVWTRSLREKDNYEQQKKVLTEVLQQQGEVGLLEMAGVEVNEIFYGEQGVSLFLGSMSDYRYSSEEMRNIAIYEKANKSVVHITTVSSALNTFLEIIPIQGTGSGVIISKNGYILTNAHVVENATELSINLHDGSKFKATLIGTDKENDLAVLKVDAPSQVVFEPIEFGSSKNLKVGQKVVTIGNPFGYDRTMTTGTVSGLGRPVRIDENTIINGMIQTDAAINPGNSGGPLLDSMGQMVGLCTTIHTTTGTSSGVSFAIPIETAIAVIPDLIKYGKVYRGWLDATLVQLDAAIVNYGGLSADKGLLVSQVKGGGKAEKGGLKGGTQRVQYGTSVIYLGGDIISAINGKPVGDYADLFSALVNTKAQDTIAVTVIRKQEIKELKIELVERPEAYQWTVR
ncbi:MAG: trypsin-like peptidase domain-containing protein [Sphaerochaetaceae bacterium]